MLVYQRVPEPMIKDTGLQTVSARSASGRYRAGGCFQISTGHGAKGT